MPFTTIFRSCKIRHILGVHSTLVRDKGNLGCQARRIKGLPVRSFYQSPFQACSQGKIIMNKREIIRSVLENKKVPYVPWHCGFTPEALAKLKSHFQGQEIEDVLQNHIINRFEVVCIRAPGCVPRASFNGTLCVVHHLPGNASGARVLTHRLLGKDWCKLRTLHRSDVTRGGEAETVTKPERGGKP